jgi:hypothetical protein
MPVNLSAFSTSSAGATRTADHPDCATIPPGRHYTDMAPTDPNSGDPKDRASKGSSRIMIGLFAIIIVMMIVIAVVAGVIR